MNDTAQRSSNFFNDHDDDDDDDSVRKEDGQKRNFSSNRFNEDDQHDRQQQIEQFQTSPKLKQKEMSSSSQWTSLWSLRAIASESRDVTNITISTEQQQKKYLAFDTSTKPPISTISNFHSPIHNRNNGHNHCHRIKGKRMKSFDSNRSRFWSFPSCSVNSSKKIHLIDGNITGGENFFSRWLPSWYSCSSTSSSSSSFTAIRCRLCSRLLSLLLLCLLSLCQHAPSFRFLCKTFFSSSCSSFLSSFKLTSKTSKSVSSSSSSSRSLFKSIALLLSSSSFSLLLLFHFIFIIINVQPSVCVNIYQQQQQQRHILEESSSSSHYQNKNNDNHHLLLNFDDDDHHHLVVDDHLGLGSHDHHQLTELDPRNFPILSSLKDEHQDDGGGGADEELSFSLTNPGDHSNPISSIASANNVKFLKKFSPFEELKGIEEFQDDGDDLGTVASGGVGEAKELLGENHRSLQKENSNDNNDDDNDHIKSSPSTPLMLDGPISSQTHNENNNNVRNHQTEHDDDVSKESINDDHSKNHRFDSTPAHPLLSTIVNFPSSSHKDSFSSSSPVSLSSSGTSTSTASENLIDLNEFSSPTPSSSSSISPMSLFDSDKQDRQHRTLIKPPMVVRFGDDEDSDTGDLLVSHQEFDDHHRMHDPIIVTLHNTTSDNNNDDEKDDRNHNHKHSLSNLLSSPSMSSRKWSSSSSTPRKSKAIDFSFSTNNDENKETGQTSLIQNERKPKSEYQAERNRNSKLGSEFIGNKPIQEAPTSDIKPPSLMLRSDSKDFVRNQPGQQPPSSMDDLIGGLAQLFGGNLKLPPNAQSGLPPGISMPTNLNGNDQIKLASLINQMGILPANGKPPFPMNRVPPNFLQNLLTRNPQANNNKISLGPGINGKLPPIPPQMINRLSPNSYPPFSIPFMPFMSPSGSSRPAIPLQSPSGTATNNQQPPPPPPSSKPSVSNSNSNLPIPLQGLTKQEMDTLFKQFMNSNLKNSLNKTRLSNGMIPKPSETDGPAKPINKKPDDQNLNIDSQSVTRFNQDDTVLIQPTRVSDEEPPQIITMPENPSVFEMVVKHKIGPSLSVAEKQPVNQKIKPTMVPASIESISSFSTLLPSLISSSSPGYSTTTTTTPSMVDVLEIRNHHTQSVKLLNQPQNNEIVYGKRLSSLKSSTYEVISPSSTSPSIPQGSTLYSRPFNGVSTSKTPLLFHQTSSSTISSTETFGKPMVMPVPIENVKPKIGTFEPNRTPIDQMPAKTSLKSNKNDNKLAVISSEPIGAGASSASKKSQAKPYVRRPSFRPRPNVPIVRIDTCIVGDDSTCDTSLHEKCITELGLSSCQCRPGYARNIPRTSCVPVVSVAVLFRVDKMAGNKIQFTRALMNSNTEEYQYLEYESIHAMNSLFLSTKTMNADLMAVKINRFYSFGGKTIVNATISLRNNDTQINSQRIKRALQQELTQAIIDSNNNLGESQLWIESAQNALQRIEDLNECASTEHNDCSKHARCFNEFGGFRCECEPGYEDRFAQDRMLSGRQCTTCSPQYCSNRGECLVMKGERVCRCRANFIGAQCDIDAEVLGVAIGGSICALIIIIITFVCLYMWNQRFKQEQNKIEAMSAASGHTFSYMNKPTALGQAATLSRMSLHDDRYGRSWSMTHDSQQHLLSPSNNNGGGGGGFYGMEHSNAKNNTSQQVYAQPVRVVMPTAASATTGATHSAQSSFNDVASMYDISYGNNGTNTIQEGFGRSRSSNTKHKNPRDHHHHPATAASLHHPHRVNGTLSGTLHYPYGSSKHDSYNETEFSTRELIYSPAHLYATNPRHQIHAYY